jgi:hypothetical protein
MKLTVKIGDTDSEIELSQEQITEIKTSQGFITKEEALANAEYFEAHKTKHKTEVLNGFDAINKKFEGLLTNEEMETYKKGDTTFKKSEALLNTLKNRLENAGDKAEMEVWKQEVEKQRKLIEEKYIAKDEFDKIQTSYSNMNKQLMGNFAYAEALSSGILDDTFKGNKYFKAMLKEAISDTLAAGLDGTKAKVIYDSETNRLKVINAKQEGELPIIVNGTNDYWDIERLVKKVLIDNKFNKQAQIPNITPGAETKPTNIGSFIDVNAQNRLKDLQNKIKQT